MSSFFDTAAYSYASAYQRDEDAESSNVFVFFSSLSITNETLATQQKLRSSKSDLKLILKYTGENGFKQVKEYDVYAQVLASLSKFIDASLSVDMKEKESRQIILHDVSPSLFEQAIKYVQDPLSIMSITPSNAINVAKFYDEYEFTSGISLCDHVLFDYLKKEYYAAVSDASAGPVDLDLLVTSIVTADECNLASARDMGIKYLLLKLGTTTSQSCCGSTMFSLEHIQKLHGLFKKGHLETVVPPGTSKEELECVLFPKYFVNYRSREFTCQSIEAVTVEGTENVFKGKYHLQPGHFYSKTTDERCCLITKSPLTGDNWAIILKRTADDGTDEHIVHYVCYHSSNLAAPPAGNVVWSCPSIDLPKPPVRLSYK